MSKKFSVITILLLQLILLILFGIFTKYQIRSEEKYDSYPLFQDVHVMIFIGFGYLMTFLKRYSYSAVGFNFLLGAFIVQWSILCQGFYNFDDNYRIQIGIDSLYEADIAAATVLISMGAVLGRTTYMQLLIMGIIEIVVFSANSHLGQTVLKVADAGGSIFVHTFGAYFGLAVSYVLVWKTKDDDETSNNLETSNYTSDLFAMIGTIFLWLFWPSFNAIELNGDNQYRAIINTYLSLTSCCVTTFALSLMLNENKNKFDMVHIQNSTLAGGVAVGTCANLMLQPWGAILIGIISAIISVIGYVKFTPWLSMNFNLKDTCGVHNLHGMPGILAGLIGSLMALLATENLYNHKSLYEIYPARAPHNLTTVELNFVQPGDGRSAQEQAGYQLLAVIVTMVIAIVSGFLTGLALNCCKLIVLSNKEYYNDAISWEIPETDDFPTTGMKISSIQQVQTQQQQLGGYYDNIAFDTRKSTNLGNRW